MRERSPKNRWGFAEVSMTIDNSDRKMNIEFNEVTITRRVFRSGESEYYINRAACRLKDIHELFMDTGLGRDGYSIIGQGQVDEIIHSKPERPQKLFRRGGRNFKIQIPQGGGGAKAVAGAG